MEKIIQEKISADHLLYVSLKYTKTTDVILNLLYRWRNLIDRGIDKILERAKKDKKIKSIPSAPKLKIDKILELEKGNEVVRKMLDLYDFFKKAETAEKIRENEFRKNVALKMQYRGNWEIINLDKLKEFNVVIEDFVKYLRGLKP
jgi:predicted restriction endonuclease